MTPAFWLGMLVGWLASTAVRPAATPVPPASGEFSVEMARVRAREPQRHFVVFSHRIHTDKKLAVDCVDCHRLGVDGNRFRPAEDSSCTPCHINDTMIQTFRKSLAERPAQPRTAPLDPIHRLHIYYKCSRCHANMRSSDKVGDYPLPPTDNSDEACVGCHGRAVRFSHARHLRVEGKIVDCSVCHRPRPEGIWYGVPGHPQCWQCHDITLLGLVEGCNYCHLENARAKKSYNIERASVLHKEHPPDKVGCRDCHAAILGAATPEELEAARADAKTHGCPRCHVIPK